MLKPTDTFSEPDVTLWEQVREGNMVAFEKLYKRHLQGLYRYGMKLCSDREVVLDCIQDLFFTIWSRKEKLSKVQSVKYYLLVSFKRELVRMLSKSRKETERMAVIPELADRIIFSTEDFITRNEAMKEQTDTLSAALNALPNREKQVIYMRFYMELSYEEICEALQLSYQVVLNYVHRALKTLRANKLINRSLTLISLLVFSVSANNFLFF